MKCKQQRQQLYNRIKTVERKYQMPLDEIWRKIDSGEMSEPWDVCVATMDRNILRG